LGDDEQKLLITFAAYTSHMYFYNQLADFTYSVFTKMGCPSDDARQATEVLIAADLRGIDSHGVARLAGYVRLWEADRINPTPDIKLVHQSPSTGVVDGDAGLGLVVAPKAMKIAINKASMVGSGWISIKNSNHFGIAGYHAAMCLEHDIIGMSMTNASPLVAPTFSTERMLGTNPIAIAIPAGQQPPFIADFATATAANGKLEILQRTGGSAPTGWVQDSEGNPSTDPGELKKGGSLLPLGSDREHSSHKGYCLGSTVDILSAVLSGANFGPWAPPFVSFLPLDPQPVGEGLGHFIGALRIDGFREVSEFKKNMDRWIERFRQSKTTQHKNVLIPGDPERAIEKERRKTGIPLNEKVVDDLQTVASRFGLQF